MKFIGNQRAIVFTAILAALLLVWSGANWRGQAQNTRLPQPSGYVNDFGEVIDVATKQRLETVLANLKERTGIEFFVATVKSAGGQYLSDYSLRVANDWNVGPNSQRKGVLLVITTDDANFFTQLSGGVQADLPDGLIGQMDRRMRPKIESAGYGPGLLTGIETFVNILGERKNFTFESLDQKPSENIIAQTRPRVVGSPAQAPTETISPPPSDTPSPQPAATATQTPAPSETPVAQPRPSAAPAAPVAETPPPSPSETPTAQPSETPSTATATPNASPLPTESPSAPGATPTSQPSETPSAAAASPSPALLQTLPDTTPLETKTSTPLSGPTRTPNPTRRTANPATVPSNPEDDLEQVELTLTLPVDKRIDALKAFIAAHPKSVAVPRANELIVAAHATLGDQKLQAGDVSGGLDQFHLAFSEAPPDLPDRLFTEVLARIPLNLFVRGQRDAAVDAAHQAEALAKLNPKRLVAVLQFYLAVEDAVEANRLAELATQAAPDSAAAHYALGAARHIALRLDDAESEYARAFALDPKLLAAKGALADLKRSAGKFEEALMLYRELLQTDPKNNSARAGLVLSLLEAGKKDEAAQELNSALQDKDQQRNLPLLVGAAYWFLAHNNNERGLELAQQAVAIEPRYTWAQIARARAMVANRKPLDAERSLRFVRQFARFPTLDYELATVLASMGLYDEAVVELARSFSLKDGQIETKLAGRSAARAASFTELLAPERRAAIFQAAPADTDANAKMLKGLLAFTLAVEPADGRSPKEGDVLAAAQDFIAGDDGMRTYRQLYLAGKLLKKGVALQSVVELMDKAPTGVEAALSVPAATVAAQAEELGDIRARALAQGGTPDVPDVPRAVLEALLRGRIEDTAGVALFNLDQSGEAVARLRRAVSVLPQGTPLWRMSLWHLGSALEANGKSDQALLYYIKSYVAGAPDAARRSVIENVYKKVNGTLDGLDDKIGPVAVTTTATPAPTPAATPGATPSPR
ncbi:MAG TPA: TPM domain-containing protein [Pyrinomonadaceae bacterium]|nr:TPM domain-containing protein [Pyrinomonadaceae bacterium]